MTLIASWGLMMLRLLGPVEVAGAPGVAADSPRQRLVLAVLAVEAGRAVPMDVLIERVWGADPPPQGRRTLHSYIARLRRMLATVPGGPMSVQGGRGAYLLQVEPQRVDLHRFRTLVGQARLASGPLDRRVEMLREAVGLWRGQPLSGLAGAWPERIRETWEHERVAAVVAWAEAELAAGDPSGVLGPLGELAADHPLDETVAAVFMRVLAGLGRTADALAQYDQIRGRLVEELGVDAGPTLRSAHQAVLRGDVSPPAQPVASAPAQRKPARGSAVPAQLPARLPVFAGRVAEVAALDALMRPDGEVAASAPVLVVVSGTAGVGKTTLAVHWGHRVTARFPDGQLYVNLRGFDPGGAALHPADVIRRFLAAFQVPAERIPADFDMQVDLYRSLLSGRRVLVILDNARDAEQVRPLLPVAPGCVTLVTSRSPQTPLVVTEGARTLALDLMSTAEAREVLVRRLGTDRTAAEPEAVEAIIARCARVPLALSVAAARAATRPESTLADTARELCDPISPLDALDSDDALIDVRSVFSWSYRSLSADAATLFRLLGLHPGPDIGAPAVASLAGAAPARVRVLLAELARAGLVQEHRPGRYTFHDLLRAYAIELAERFDSGSARDAARRRVIEYYLEATCTQGKRAAVSWPLSVEDQAGVHMSREPADRARALAWLATERDVLLAVIDRAAGADPPTQAWRLAWELTFYLLRQGHWHDLREMHRTVLAACERTNDVVGQSHMVHGLALGYARSGCFDEARPHFDRAWALAEQTGDRILQGRLCSSRAWLAERGGDATTALERARLGLEMYRAVGFRWGEAEALGDVGWCLALLGQHKQAIDHCERALAMLAESGRGDAEAAITHSIGHIHQQLGNFAEAVTWCQRSIDVYRQLGDLYNEGLMHGYLGDVHTAAGEPDAARAAWRRAVDMLDDLEHPDAAEFRAKLDA